MTVQNQLKFYIDGQWVDPTTPATHDVVNPSTEEVCARISMGSAADVHKAVAAARRAFETYSQTTREDRLALLGGLSEALRRHRGRHFTGDGCAPVAVQGRAGGDGRGAPVHDPRGAEKLSV